VNKVRERKCISLSFFSRTKRSFWEPLSGETNTKEECESEFANVNQEDVWEGKYRNHQDFLNEVGEGNPVAVCIRLVQTDGEGQVRAHLTLAFYDLAFL